MQMTLTYLNSPSSLLFNESVRSGSGGGVGVNPIRLFSWPPVGPELELLELSCDIRLHLKSLSLFTVLSSSIRLVRLRLELFSANSFFKLSTALLERFLDSSVSFT